MTRSNTTVSVLDGVTQITVDNADAVLSQLLQLSGDAVDLSAVAHCDSAGIAVLLEARAAWAKQRQQKTFLHPSQQLHDLAAFLKVTELLFHQS